MSTMSKDRGGNAQVTRHVVRLGRGAPLQVACVDPFPNPGSVFVVAMGFGACLEPFELWRFAGVAATLSARLLVVETPGCGYTPARLLGRERVALLRGDFRPLAARMLAAAVAVDRDSGHQRAMGVLGYSMGASLAAAMAAGASGGPQVIDAVVLVEPVANRRWSPQALVAAKRAEARLVGEYLAANQNLPGAVAPPAHTPGAALPHQDRLGMLLSGNALRGGRMSADVSVAARGRAGLPVVIARGDTSLLSEAAACAHMASDLRATGADVHEVVVNGQHGLWQSLPAAGALCELVAAALRH